MKKSILLMSLFMLASIMAHAVPARPGMWRTITLDNGSTVVAMLKGDETLNFYEDKDGNRYMANEDGTYSLTSAEAFKKAAKAGQTRRRALGLNGPKRVADIGGQVIGNKHCLIILVEFPDMKFQAGHDQAFYNRVANEEGFTSSDGFVGSIRDYFTDQSDGKFTPTFDVKGPYMMSKSYTYYGGNSGGTDANVIDMAKEATTAAYTDGVDFSQYDWDGDGDVDLVYFIYAGCGEANGGSASTIWPHASRGPWFGSYSGVQQRQYACSNEVHPDSNDPTGTTLQVEGIGTICHEFSHCLGFPDLYDIDYSGGYGMGSWDLMSSGSYNGNSFRPAGYSAYEKWVAGWITPTELGKNDVAVKNLKAMSAGGGSYVIYNDAHNDEFYMLENRQQTGWDTDLAGSGLLITHIDYDATAWARNTVNDDPGHQRCTIVPADRVRNDATEKNDPYPYSRNNSFTYESNPQATVFNTNTDGSNLLNHGVTDITRNADGTVSFNYVADCKPAPPTEIEETVLHESFDKCSGRGGGSGAWGVSNPGGAFTPDVTGWETQYTALMAGGNKCAYFGARNYTIVFSSPSFTLTGDETTITAIVAPFAATSNQTFTVSLNDQQIGSYTLKNEQWNTITIKTTVKGQCRLKFSTNDRLWFDDLAVVQKTAVSGIDQVTVLPSKTASNRIYSVNGTFVGTDFKALPKGIYIVNGKKVVK